MSDTQMKNVGQIQPAKKPAKDQISSADQRSSPGSPVSWREIRTTLQVRNNNRIACQTVNFHDAPVGPLKQKSERVSIRSCSRSRATNLNRGRCALRRWPACPGGRLGDWLHARKPLKQVPQQAMQNFRPGSL